MFLLLYRRKPAPAGWWIVRLTRVVMSASSSDICLDASKLRTACFIDGQLLFVIDDIDAGKK